MSDSTETDKQDPKTAAQLSDSPETDMYAPKMGFHMSDSAETDTPHSLRTPISLIYGRRPQQNSTSGVRFWLF